MLCSRFLVAWGVFVLLSSLVAAPIALVAVRAVCEDAFSLRAVAGICARVPGESGEVRMRVRTERPLPREWLTEPLTSRDLVALNRRLSTRCDTARIDERACFVDQCELADTFFDPRTGEERSCPRACSARASTPLRGITFSGEEEEGLYSKILGVFLLCAMYGVAGLVVSLCNTSYAFEFLES